MYILISLCATCKLSIFKAVLALLKRVSKSSGRRVRIFDRPDGRGIVGYITDVYDEFNFRIMTDNGSEYEFSTKLVTVQFVDGDGR